MNREAIYSALFALGQSVTWAGGGSFSYTSRRAKLFSEIPSWPAFCQAEHDETSITRTGLPDITTLGAVWLIYHNAGKDPGAVPATTSNAILDALDNLFPSEDDGSHQTLGGLVHRVAINGRVIKEHGDLDGQGLLILPLRIMVA